MTEKTAETALQVVTWTIGIALPMAVAWFATCWIRNSPRTLFARALLAAGLALVSARAVHYWILWPSTRGIWKCSVCGLSEYQVRFWDLCVYSDRLDFKWANEHEEVSAITAGIQHEHDWLLAIGAITFGDGGRMCSMGVAEGIPYFACLASIPSPEIAASMVTRIASAPLEKRREMVFLFETPKLGEPFQSLWHGARPGREEFEQAYVAWLDRHPEWK